MKKILYILGLTATTMVSAQVGIGTVTPDPDSALEVASTDKGLLMPRIALTGTASAAPLSAHVMGMMIYNIATASDVTPGYYINDGTKWVMMAGPWRNPDGTAAGPASTDINYMNGNIGIGITIPTSRLHVHKRHDDIGGTDTAFTGSFISRNVVPPGNSQNFTSGDFYSISSLVRHRGSGNINTVTSGQFLAQVQNGTVVNLIGTSSEASVTNNLATVTNITSGLFKTSNVATITNENILNLQAESSTGISTIFNGIKLDNILRENSTTVSGINIGTVTGGTTVAGTVAHGLKIGDVSGADTNYAIQTGEGEVIFGDNVGIGTTTPNEKLEVNGKVRVSDLTGADLATDVIVTADAITGELKEGGTLSSVVTANETVTTMTQNATTGIITYTNESAGTTTANVVSANANNAIKAGTDGGAYMNATGKIVFSAEYAGATLDADGTNNLGFMTSDNAGAGNSWMNYYEWYSAETTIQDYDVVLRFTLPNDFTSWNAANAIVIDYVTETGSTANNNFTVTVYLESNAASLATVGATANAAWSTVTISGGSLATLTAGTTGVIVLKMSSVNNNFVRLGDITLNYTK